MPSSEEIENIISGIAVMIVGSIASCCIFPLLNHFFGKEPEIKYGARFFTRVPTKTPTQRLENINFPLVDVPDHLCCLLTGEPMTDPVLLEGDGQTYERAAIVKYLKENLNKSPSNNSQFAENLCRLIRNQGKLSEIENFVTERESEFGCLRKKM